MSREVILVQKVVIQQKVGKRFFKRIHDNIVELEEIFFVLVN